LQRWAAKGRRRNNDHDAFRCSCFCFSVSQINNAIPWAMIVRAKTAQAQRPTVTLLGIEEKVTA
jgi:hypothetical protein